MSKVKIINGYKGTIDNKINEWATATGASVQNVTLVEGQTIWGNSGWVTATVVYEGGREPEIQRAPPGLIAGLTFVVAVIIYWLVA